jgi:hypothetical protein
MHISMQFRHSPQFSAQRPERRPQTLTAIGRVLCHNMCWPIRVMWELDVEVTFDGERESTRALHQTGPLAQCRVQPLTCQYIYVKCT